MLRNLPRFFALAVLAGGILTGCDSTPTGQASPTVPAASENATKVVATNSVLCDLTKQIAANTVALKCLIAAGTDPHLYQPSPSDRQAIEDAKLILYGSYDFEPEIVKLIKATSNPAPKVAVDQVAVPQPQKFIDEGESVNDPHVFHSAANGVLIANVIRDQLSQLAPNNAQLYSQNAQKVTTELDQINTWIKGQIATIPPSARKLVTTHDAFGYYATAYGIPVEGALQGISTEEKPTAARVAKLTQEIKQSGVPTIFAELTINPKLIQTVAKEANVKVASQELFADGLGGAGTPADTYPKMLIANTQTIVEGLGGKFTPFKPN